MRNLHHSTITSSSYKPASTTPEHLNNTGCKIKYSDGRVGESMVPSRAIPAYTLLEISPVLLFSAEEYGTHGRHTVLDHYTFKWRDGRMALALGLGSLFNHSDFPNVSYSIDTATESIRYTTVRAVECDEELCIHYGSNLWFKPVEIAAQNFTDTVLSDDGWGGLSAVRSEITNHVQEVMPNPNVIVPDDDLPRRETLDTIRTVQAWAVDIPDPRHITSSLKWLKSSGIDTPALAHLKRVRKSPTGTHTTLLLTTTTVAATSSTSTLSFHTAPELPPDFATPYQLTVPRSAALTPASLALKNTLWPTVFAPRRKGEPEDWSRARVHWACTAMARVVQEAHAAHSAGEVWTFENLISRLPIASYVPAPLEEPTWPSYLARDTRISLAHPLRHATLNVVRALADLTGTSSASATAATSASASAYISTASSPSPPPASTTSSPSPTGTGPTAKNGQHYLLTSRALFTTHEPCVMCSMALLHSRVKEVFFLIPMGRTGGCGGAVCVPKLDGVNHRFSIGWWKPGAGGVSADGLEIDEDIDS
ncbi:hypothetical protein B0F90DRAFT_1810171 [Multifurca ochricompacta]|uniref:SET domain-containing protein n=1 Tax=Multifurca ochricompacta TaxID=376703 RepID=A0AAD4M3X0_9AGAM|nr:hypothetical protein B0F90DRAFT_1810171 [Multifurca ochricompacta]